MNTGFGRSLQGLSFVAVVLLTCPATGDPVQWSGNGHWYEHVSVPYDPGNPLCWAAAKALAEAAGGTLATITSPEEDAWIWGNLGGTALIHSWLGGFQPPGSPEPAGNWQWVTGEPWSYTHWAPYEPNNNCANDPGCESALMLGRWGEQESWWNDLDPCTHNYSVDYATGYIVEWVDCNANGIPDGVDIANGTSLDANGNGIPDECEACYGDLNCDALVDFVDINAFVLYLSNLPVWQTTYADCNAANGDIDGDGVFPSFGDINPFVTLLTTHSLPLACDSR